MSDLRYWVSGRRALGLLVGTILVSYLVFFHSSFAWTSTQTSAAAASASADLQWHFDASVHERDYGLTDEQCDAAFPGLWTNIQKVHRQREKEGKLTQFTIDKSFAGDDVVRVLVYDRQVKAPIPSVCIETD